MAEQDNAHPIASFDDFWPYYLREHLDSTCRLFHYVGSIWGLLCVLNLFTTGSVLWLVYGIVGGYGMAWLGHFVFEKNKPATFQYPLWSFMGDWRMLWLWLSGGLDAEIEKVKTLPSLKDVTS